MTQAFVGIDAGTTGCTVMIFDEQGERLGHGYEEYPCTSPRAGWIEQDVEAVWQGICAASQRPSKTRRCRTRPIARSACRASAAHSSCSMTPRSRLGNSIVWNCGRALKYQEMFSKEISPADHQDHTGMQLSPLWSAAKIAWLRDNEPAIFEKTRWFANGQEYFLYRLGAEEWVTDPASLTLNGMMEIRKLDWSDRILALSGIDRDRLPPVGIPSGKAGKLSKAAADATGLPEGIALCRGAGRPAMRRNRRRRDQAGHGRVHRRHIGRDGRASRQSRSHQGQELVVGRPRRCPAPGTSRVPLSALARVSNGGATIWAAMKRRWAASRHSPYSIMVERIGANRRSAPRA